MPDQAADVNRFACIAMLVVMGALAGAVLLVAPVLVGAMVDRLGFSPAQAAYVISIDMAGMGLATIPALLWLDRINWQRVARIALPGVALCHIFAGMSTDFNTFLAIRFAGGLCAGTIMAICLAAIGLTDKRERNYGLWVVGQLLIGAVALALLPRVLPLWGLKSFFWTLAAIIIVVSFYCHNIPAGATRTARAETQDAAKPALFRALLGILGLLCFYIGLSAVWTYLERLAVAQGIAAQSIGYVLSAASLLGIAGSLCAVVLGGRRGRMLPVSLGIAIVIAALLVLMNPLQLVLFFLGTALFKFAWTFILPFLLAALSALDRSGKIVIIANIAIGGGLALGPAIAGHLVQQDNYTPVLLLGLSAMLLCYSLYWPIIRAPRDREGSRTYPEPY